LEDNSSGLEGDFGILLTGVLPVQNSVNVGGLHAEVVAVSNCRFEENPDGVGKGL
jgi:hypothetical protein